jgi:hypothetical protein
VAVGKSLNTVVLRHGGAEILVVFQSKTNFRRL